MCEPPRIDVNELGDPVTWLAELARIGPHDHRHLRALLVAGRQIERAGQRDAVLAFVGDVLPQDVADLWLRIFECRDGTLGVGTGVADEEIRRVLLGFVASHELRHRIVERCDERFERFRRRPEDALGFQRLDVQLVEERTIAFG
jgi:hypothetical protein